MLPRSPDKLIDVVCHEVDPSDITAIVGQLRPVLLGTIGNLHVIDMPMRFPRYTMLPRSPDKLIDVVCHEVDPSDITAIVGQLRRGMSPDWERCRAHWRAEGVTDVT